MKYSIFLLSLVLTIPTALAGGFSGGGGNVKPGQRITKEDAIQAIEQNRRFVLFYFNAREHFLKSSDEWTALDRKLFGAAPTVTDRALAVRVTIEKNGPCRDGKGNAVDGSAVATVPQSICISADRLVEKLDRQNFQMQVVALMIHEYSHLVGLNEREANTLQSQALAELVGADFVGTKNYLTDTCRLTTFLYVGTKMATEDPGQYTREQLHNLIGEAAYTLDTTFPRVWLYKQALYPHSVALQDATDEQRFSLRDSATKQICLKEDLAECHQQLRNSFEFFRAYDSYCRGLW